MYDPAIIAGPFSISWSLDAFREFYSQTFQGSLIDCRHLILADLAEVSQYPQLIDSFDLFQADD